MIKTLRGAQTLRWL